MSSSRCAGETSLATSFRHGTLTGYSKYRCSCDACREAWRAYQHAYYREVQRHGLCRMVDVAPVAAYIEKLLASGMTLTAISAVSGVDRGVLRRIRTGERQQLRCRAATAERIHGVPRGATTRDTTTSARHAVRLLDGLRAAGVSNEQIREQLGIADPSAIRSSRWVRPKTWQKLILLYRYLARRGLVDAEVLAEVGAI